MKRVRVRSPFVGDECVVVGDDWVPLSCLSAMLHWHPAVATLTKKFNALVTGGEVVAHRHPSGGVYRNFVRIKRIPAFLREEGWDEEKIARAMRTFEPERQTPPRKRSAGEEMEKEEPAKKPAVDEGFGPMFGTLCAEAARVRVKQLEPLIVKRIEDEERPKVIRRLEERYRIEVKQRIEAETRAALNKPFELPTDEKLLEQAFARK
jgi:hypothetical protein